jgi:hypothetical protein
MDGEIGRIAADRTLRTGNVTPAARRRRRDEPTRDFARELEARPDEREREREDDARESLPDDAEVRSSRSPADGQPGSRIDVTA